MKSLRKLNHSEWEDYNSETCSQASELMNVIRDLSIRYIDDFCIPESIISLYSYSNGKLKDEKLYQPYMLTDFANFTFTKCTKTFAAICALTDDWDFYFGEDIRILSRAILECFSKYETVKSKIIQNEDDEKLEGLFRGFIFNAMSVDLDINILKKGKVYSKKDNVSKGPSYGINTVKNNTRHKYFSMLYSYLSSFTHASYGTMAHYLNEASYSCYLDQDYTFALLIAMFCFERVYESFVLTCGDFEGKEFIEYTKIAYDVLDFLRRHLTLWRQYYDEVCIQDNQILYAVAYFKDDLNGIAEGKKLAQIIDEMLSSLDDPISFLDKGVYRKGRYLRKRYTKESLDRYHNSLL